MGTYTIFAVFSTDFSISISLVFINIKIDVFSKLFNIIFYEGGGWWHTNIYFNFNDFVFNNL